MKCRPRCRLVTHPCPPITVDVVVAKALSKLPAAALNGRGEIAMRRRQLNSALHDFNVAITRSPDYAYRNRGEVKHASGP
jgi:hypothetical protein